MSWLACLSDEVRERVFAVMRQYNEESLNLWVRAQELGPRFGQVPIGSDDMNYVLRATAIEEFLRALRNGYTPPEAEVFARAQVALAVKKWNEVGRKSRAGFTREDNTFSEEHNAGSQSLTYLRQRLEMVL